MGIQVAIDRAYSVAKQRKWDTIYWAVDLHGVCLKSNYENGSYEWINGLAQSGMRTIASRRESKIILWSSCHDDEKIEIKKWFEKQGIPIFGFNENPAEKDTVTGCFKEKFYFSVLLDDKAGFDPDQSWIGVIMGINRNIL